MKDSRYFPYLRIGKVNEILKEIPEEYLDKEFTTRDIANATGANTTTINNFIATLKALKFMTGRRKLRFTEPGTRYALLIRAEDGAARRVLEEQVNKIEYFDVIKNKLQERGKLTIFEIGEEIVRRYDKKWTNPLTLKTYGAAIASILDFTGFGHYRSGILRLEEETAEMGSPAPYLSVEKMLRILEVLFPMGSEIHELAKEIGTNERRLSQELACCRALGFVKHSRRGFYELTADGREIARCSDGLRRRLFTEHLYSSGYKKLIERLYADGGKLTLRRLGEMLAQEFNKDWSTVTKRTYAKKFLNWLRYSGIVVKVQGGYKLRE